MNPKEKFHLFKTNKNFCSAPWNLLYVDTNGAIKICVNNHGKLGNLHQSSLPELLQSPNILKIKKDMLEDKPIAGCTACHKLEKQIDSNTSYKFLRNMYNELFVDQDINYHDINQFNFSALDLHWGSVCDLKCVTCWPHQSSSLAVEQGVPITHIDSKIVADLIDIIVSNQHKLKEIYLSGGEPTLIKHNLALLSRIDKREDLQIRINSNMMWKQDNSILQEVLKFPNVLFTCSADNTKEKFDYIRRGARWEKFLENLQFLTERSNVEIRINLVFFVLSALDLIDTIDFFAENYNIKDFTINQCSMGQTHLRCRNLPEHLKPRVIENLEQAKQKYAHDVNLLGQLTNCLMELGNPKSEDFNDYFSNIDILAGTKFQLVFPELS